MVRCFGKSAAGLGDPTQGSLGYSDPVSISPDTFPRRSPRVAPGRPTIPRAAELVQHQWWQRRGQLLPRAEKEVLLKSYTLGAKSSSFGITRAEHQGWLVSFNLVMDANSLMVGVWHTCHLLRHDVAQRRSPPHHRTGHSGRGRDAGYPTPPAQIPACGPTALGSCLGS
jgi:hypothetical protein